MKLHEAAAFTSAFQNESAKSLVQNMMAHNYADAIMVHHPRSTMLDNHTIQNNCLNLVETLFTEIGGIQNEPALLRPLLQKLSRNHRPMASIWFEDFNMAYDTYKHGSKLKMKVEQLLPYLHGKSYCDIGCGGGDLVACIKELHPRFTSYTGIDVLDWRTESLKNVINFQMLDFSDPGAVSPVKYDLATCMAVLHHVGHDDRSRKLFLRNVRKAIAENGRLVVEEDVILPGEELEANAHYRLQVAKRISAQPYFQEYTALSMEEQRCVLTIIDLLANSLIVGVPDMAFPFGFKTINGWTNLFYECGFAVEMVQIKGFTPGMFNQSAHVHFILARN